MKYLGKLRRDPGYLDRQGFKVIAPNGKVIGPVRSIGPPMAADRLLACSSRREKETRWVN